MIITLVQGVPPAQTGEPPAVLADRDDLTRARWPVRPGRLRARACLPAGLPAEVPENGTEHWVPGLTTCVRLNTDRPRSARDPTPCGQLHPGAVLVRARWVSMRRKASSITLPYWPRGLCCDPRVTRSAHPCRDQCPAIGVLRIMRRLPKTEDVCPAETKESHKTQNLPLSMDFPAPQ